MGYYSIYKIIKDIIKTIFNSKVWRYFLIGVIICFILAHLFPNGVFAVSYIGANKSYYVDDSYLYDYYFICEGNSGTWALLYTSPMPMTYYSNNSVTCDISVYSSSYRRGFGNIAQTIDGNVYNFAMITSYPPINNTTALSNGNFGTYNNNNYHIVASNYDVKDGNGNVVFAQNLEVFNSPQFYNKTNFVDFSDDSLVIYPNDYGISDTLYLHMLTVDSSISDDSNTYYYYGQRIFALNSNSDYLGVIDGIFYYNIPRYTFSLEANKKYIFFLSDNDESINNSVGLYDYSDDFDGFVLEPTIEQISPSDTIIDNQQNQNNSINNIDNFLNNDNVDDKTNEDIDNSLNKDTTTNSDMIVTSFFTRLTSIITDLGDYNLQEDTEIVLPVPFTNGNIVLHSNYLYTYLSSAFKVIIEGFWYYLFGFYIFKFVNKIYISIKSGKILDGVSSSDEVITNDML